MLYNGLLREFRGLKHIVLLCPAQRAADTTRHPLWRIRRTSRGGYSTWDRFQGREVSTRLKGKFCNLLFLRKSLFLFSARGAAHPAPDCFPARSGFTQERLRFPLFSEGMRAPACVRLCRQCR